MKTPCPVIEDLIPLVKDQVASPESIKLVEDHIKSCKKCKEELGQYQNHLPLNIKDDKKIIKSIKKGIYKTQIIILAIGAIIGILLTNTMGMFYNLLIMPILGGISYFVFNKRSYLMVLIVFCLSYGYITISSIVIDGFYWGFFYGSLIYSLIYSFLIMIGIIISLLLKIAFEKEG